MFSSLDASAAKSTDRTRGDENEKLYFTSLPGFFFLFLFASFALTTDLLSLLLLELPPVSGLK